MRHTKDTQGFVIATVLITVLFVMTIMIVAVQYGANNYTLSAQESYRVNAQFAADAGIDAGINELNIDPDWTGSGGEVTLLDTGAIRTTYESTLLNGAEDDEKILSVIARSYAPSTATEPRVERRYELDLLAVTSGTSITSVVSGVGGLVLNNNAKITGGDVVVNGTIDMSNQSQIGTQSNAVNVRVAHQTCPQPANASYPQVCGAGNGEPIDMSNNARIYGDVQANNQVDDDGMSSPGLTANSGVTPVDLPEYDRSQHSGATEFDATDSAVRCPNNNGSVTWQANIKINGNVDMKNNCTITIRGDVWITGNFTTGNQGTIIVDDVVGNDRPVIMIDGASGFNFSNNGEIVPNSQGTGVEMRTFWSHSSSGCSPNCTNLTGTGLANSQNVTTIDLGNNGDAPNSVFIAQWSRVRVSNNGALGAVAGQSIYLSNQAVINFTASVPGSDNLTISWVKRGYMRVYD